MPAEKVEHVGMVWNAVLPINAITTDTAEMILNGGPGGGGLLKEALSEFLSKNADYQDASDALGLIGQVSDLWRKVVKLKAATIDGKELNGEDVSQLLRDIFGHALLAMVYEKSYSARPQGQPRPHETLADPLGEWIDRNGKMPFAQMLEHFRVRVARMSQPGDEPPEVIMLPINVPHLEDHEVRELQYHIESKYGKPISYVDNPHGKPGQVIKDAETGRIICGDTNPKDMGLDSADVCTREWHADRHHRGRRSTWAD